MHLNILVSFLMTISDSKNISDIIYNSNANNNMTVINISLDGYEINANNISDVVKANGSILNETLKKSTTNSEVKSEPITPILKVSGQLDDVPQVIAADHNDEIKSSFNHKNMSKDLLYRSIIEGKYIEAVYFTKIFNEHVVPDVISRLFETDSRKIVEYAYQLWIANEKDIVARCFPSEYSTIFKGDHFKIVNKDFGTAITFSGDSDIEDQRKPITGFLNAIQSKSIWKSFPVWENNTLYFKLYNIHTNFYLEVNNYKHSDGDHGVWGEEITEAQQDYWTLKPVGLNQYKIINPKYGVLLSIHEEIPRNAGFAVVWASSEELCEQNKDTFPCYYEWNIVPIS